MNVETVVILSIISYILGLFILYFIIEIAAKNGIIKAFKHLKYDELLKVETLKEVFIGKKKSLKDYYRSPGN